MVFFKNIVIHPWFIIVTFCIRKGYQFDQIFISCFIFTKQDQVIIILIQHLFPVKPGSRGNIDLAADNRLDPVLFTRFIKRHGAVHIAVIGYCKGSHAQLFCAQNKRLDAAGAVKQRIFGVQMKMGKHNDTSLNYYKQCSSSSSGSLNRFWHLGSAPLSRAEVNTLFL